MGSVLKIVQRKGFFFFKSVPKKRRESESEKVRERRGFGGRSSQVVSSSYHGYKIKH